MAVGRLNSAVMARLVIDTNVLISALAFKDSRHLRLRDAWQLGQVTPLLSVRTYREDQKFVETAHCGHADALLTYDRALLKMRKRVSFDVLKPEVWMETAFP